MSALSKVSENQGRLELLSELLKFITECNPTGKEIIDHFIIPKATDCESVLNTLQNEILPNQQS